MRKNTHYMLPRKPGHWEIEWGATKSSCGDIHVTSTAEASLSQHIMVIVRETIIMEVMIEASV